MYWLLALAFIIIGLWNYPLTFRLCLVDGRWSLLWLPKVFLGYARPPQPRAKPVAEVDINRRALRLPWRLYGCLLRHLRLQQAQFIFIPGYGRVSCIFYLSLGDIIRSIIELQIRRRNKYGRKQRRRARY